MNYPGEYTKKNRLQKRISVILVTFAVSLAIPVLSGCSTGMEKQIEKEADLIAQSGKNAVFVADYDISDFNETYFSERRGIPTYVSRSLNIEKTKDLIKSERDRLFKIFEESSRFKPYRPQGNFMPLRILEDGITSQMLFDRCIKKGLMIRDCSTFPYLGDNYIRFCFMNPEDNNRLVATLLD